MTHDAEDIFATPMDHLARHEGVRNSSRFSPRQIRQIWHGQAMAEAADCHSRMITGVFARDISRMFGQTGWAMQVPTKRALAERYWYIRQAS
jgi:hypothetical protein